ncbi:MAG: tetratricopeptide repeat protein [Thermaerobacter sp.]|nr:tetratricopeptide repeat protein [Thermaerobacter sp.]
MAAREEEMLGWKRLEQGQLDRAEGHFRRSLEMDPDRVEALNGLGQVYMAWDELDEAAELFQMALAIAEPNLPRGKRRTGWHDPHVRPYLRSLHLLAMTRIRRGAYQSAAEPLETMLAWDATGVDGEAYLLLGQCRQRLGEVEVADACYEKARLKHPHAWYLYGLTRLLLGHGPDAVHCFKAAVDVVPEVAPLLAFYPRVRGIGGEGAPRHRQAVQFVNATVDLFTRESRELLRSLMTGEVASAQ